MTAGSSSSRRVAAAAATCGALALSMVVTGATTADARPGPKLGPVADLTASVTKAHAEYAVAATWDGLAGAAGYRASLSMGGTVVDSATLGQPSGSTVSWKGHVTAPASTKVTIKVVAFDARRPGRTASYAITLPDLTAPTGSFSISREDRTVTLTEISVGDDVTPSDQVLRSVNWDEGAGPEPFLAGQAPVHVYPVEDRVWHPTVTLADTADPANIVRLPLAPVVIDDHQPPTGSYSSGPGSAWAGLTPVTLTQTSLSDGAFSRPDDIARTVDWGDGTDPAAWPAGGAAPSHVYGAAGTFTPVVHLVDEAGNVADVSAPPVGVRADSTAPRVTVVTPRRHRAWVRSWTTLRGAARDRLGTGVEQVAVRAVEKRGRTWYAYKAPRRVWVRAGARKAAALAKARPATSVPAGGRWQVRVAKLRKGTLTVSVTAVDRVQNTSRPVVVTRRLTHR